MSSSRLRRLILLWYYEVSKCAPQFALRHLASAWRDCFSKKKKRPKFKKKGRHDSFTLDGTIHTLSSHSIQVPVIGKLKTYEGLPTIHKPKNVTISREADRWFISFKIEVESIRTDKKIDVVGIDIEDLNVSGMMANHQKTRSSYGRSYAIKLRSFNNVRKTGRKW